MARVRILSSAEDVTFDPWRHGTSLLLKHSAEVDTFGEHQLVEDPAEADLILFAEMGECGTFAERVRAHPYFRRFRSKCFLFDGLGDITYPLLPGVFCSLRKDFYRPDHARTGFYMSVIQNAYINFRQPTGREKYLASFVGSSETHPMRRALFSFQRDDIYVADTSGVSGHMMYHGVPTERAKFWSDYADTLANSRFSLCPRGRAPNSIRLYESMKMGRACVILSDEWPPNDGVDWDSCSLRVPEADVGRLPDLLDQYADRSVEMGRNARREWEKWFSPQVAFHRIVEQCLEIASLRGPYSVVRSFAHYLPIVKHPRLYLSSKRNLYRNNHRIYW
jgi:hypothetical protein